MQHELASVQPTTAANHGASHPVVCSNMKAKSSKAANIIQTRGVIETVPPAELLFALLILKFACLPKCDKVYPPERKRVRFLPSSWWYLSPSVFASLGVRPERRSRN